MIIMNETLKFFYFIFHFKHYDQRKIVISLLDTKHSQSPVFAVLKKNYQRTDPRSVCSGHLFFFPIF